MTKDEVSRIGAADLSDLALKAFRVRLRRRLRCENPAPRFAARRIDRKFIPAKPDSPDLFLLPLGIRDLRFDVAGHPPEIHWALSDLTCRRRPISNLIRQMDHSLSRLDFKSAYGKD